MSKKILSFIFSVIIALCVAAVIFFTLGGTDSFSNRTNQEQRRTRIIIPGETSAEFQSANADEIAARADNFNIKAPLNDGEIIASAVNQDFNSDSIEDQFIAYRNIHESESPVYVAYIEYDEKMRSYQRIWSAPAAATRPGTVSLYTMDIIGDRSVCVILAGINGQGEHTMTIFRWNGQKQTGQTQDLPDSPLFVKIAELRIDGSIRIQEVPRSQAYQLGIAVGQSFTIAAYEHNPESANILDQTENIYTYNPEKMLYERSKVTHIPGSQIEQRRLRELLSGTPGVFENFINDLWYYVSPQGTVDNRQYIYFDPANRELIFYGEEAQQVFRWQNSSPTRYGLYVSSQNISVSTLRRFIDIELESLDSIRVKVFEDVRMKIGGSAAWDGSYRRAGTAAQTQEREANTIKPYISAVYDSPMGKFTFYSNGEYELSAGSVTNKGWYVFFEINGQELLELRPADMKNTTASTNNGDNTTRMIYRADRTRKDELENSPENISLTRIRLGAAGIQELHEGTIALTPAEKPH